MKTAFVLGGTGFVGRHLARRLADGGWRVTIASRGVTEVPPEVAGIDHVVVDRREKSALKSAVGGGFDVFVDVAPYEIEDALQVVELQDLIGKVVAISTTSVYADHAGQTMDETTGPDDSPQMPVPIRETQARTEPSEATYSTKKVAIEDILLGQSNLAATVIRPCAIYGPGDTQCREWFFVKRVLDRRPFVLLADEGKSVFHTTSVLNLAEVVALAAETPAHGAFNCGDPDPPNVLRIAGSICEQMGHEWREVLLSRALSGDWKWRNPWAGFHDWVVSMDKAHEELGYEPVTTYEDAIGETLEWIIGATRDKDWRRVLPQAADYLESKFDYEAEEALVKKLDEGVFE